MKLIKTLLNATLLIPTLLLAENIEVGNRPMSDEAKVEIESKKRVDVDLIDNETQETSGYGYDRYAPIFYSSSHHRLVQILVRDNGDYILELEDGSNWKISNYDAPKAVNWLINDALAITQNNRWFSRHNYRIINKNNGTSVEATLFLGPLLNGEYSRYIVSIDHSRREIVLSDNTHWDITYLDSVIFKDWALYDYIILGTNSETSFWDSSADSLLINVNMNNCVRAKQF